MSFTAGSVMNASAALLNDVGLTNFTYAFQIPYLNIAMAELQEVMEANNIPTTNAPSVALTVAIGVTELSFSTTPALPAALVEIQGAYEKQSGVNEDYIEMTKVEFLPQLAILTNSLIYWCWQEQKVKFLGALSARQVKLDYIKSLFAPITTSADIIDVINAQSFLNYRNAALCAQFIGENESRATALNIDAGLALDRMIGISTKGRQLIPVRRRPFQSGWISRWF